MVNFIAYSNLVFTSSQPNEQSAMIAAMGEPTTPRSRPIVGNRRDRFRASQRSRTHMEDGTDDEMDDETLSPEEEELIDLVLPLLHLLPAAR